MLTGAHMSISGGVFKAPLRGREVGCQTVQIFTKSSNQWKAKELTEEEVAAFKKNRDDTAIAPIIAHDSYLINLAARDEALWKKSIDAFHEELRRAELLEIPYLVTHPGAHMGAGEEAGLKRLAEAFNILLGRTRGYKVKVAFETTAGQGTSLGYRFEHIAWLLENIEDAQRLAVCFDTCHVFAAGYDLASEASFKKTLEEFDEVIGLGRLKVVHLNDSKKGLGSRVDRHEHIGKGCLGLEPFRFIMNYELFEGLPLILETPKGPDCKEDVMNLEVLRGLVKKVRKRGKGG